MCRPWSCWSPAVRAWTSCQTRARATGSPGCASSVRRAWSRAWAARRPSCSRTAGPSPSWTSRSSRAALWTTERRTGPAGTRRSGAGALPKSSQAPAKESARIRHASATASASRHCRTPSRTRPAAASSTASPSSARSCPRLSTSHPRQRFITVSAHLTTPGQVRTRGNGWIQGPVDHISPPCATAPRSALRPVLRPVLRTVDGTSRSGSAGTPWRGQATSETETASWIMNGAPLHPERARRPEVARSASPAAGPAGPPLAPSSAASVGSRRPAPPGRV